MTKPYSIDETNMAMLEHIAVVNAPRKCSMLEALEELGCWVATCGASERQIALAAGLSRNTMYRGLNAMQVETLLRVDELRQRGLGADEIKALAKERQPPEGGDRRPKGNGSETTRSDGPPRSTEELER